MTSPNATATTDMTVPVATVPDALHAGFRQHWAEAEDGDVTADLAAGAGLGSPYLILSVERKGKPTIHETIDVRDFLPGWINAAIARADDAAPSVEPAKVNP